MNAVPTELGHLLGQPLAGASRIVVTHARRSRFRTAVIFELLVGIPCFCCIVPVIVVVALMSDDIDLELPSFRGRFYERWHEIGVAAVDPAGRVIAGTVLRPGSAEEGDAAVAWVLGAADREGLVVIETIEPGEPVEVWYGGRALLAHPEQVVEASAAEVLRAAGFAVQAGGESLSLSYPLPPVPRILAALLMIVLLPLLPLAIFAPSLLTAYKHLWADVRGERPGVRTIEVRAESVRAFSERSGIRFEEVMIDGRDLVGVTFSPTLGFDPDVTRRSATLRFIGRTRTLTLAVPRLSEVGRAVRDWLVAGTLRLRAARPELGLLGAGPRPTRCPYCRTLYDMLPSTRCPNCGAPAGTHP